MKVLVVVVGKARRPLSDAIDAYEKRAARYWKLGVVEVSAGAPGGAREAVLEAEGARILKRIPDGFEVVALTRAGSTMDSVELAGYLEAHGVRSTPGVAFVIGGAFGLGRAVSERATRALSVSPMTLPHEMARLLLAEQLYRAGTLVRGEPYHKG